MHNLTKPFKILVVSNNLRNRTELRTNLHIAHYDVITAQSEAEALKLASAIEVDLTLIDVEKGNFDSLKLLEKFKNYPSAGKMPLLYLGENGFKPSGYLEDSSVGFIQRPISIDKLKDKIRTLLTLRCERQQIQERIHQFESHFAFKFAREIRFPVSIISGFAHLMHQNHDNLEISSHMEYLHQIVKQADHLQDRVDDLTYLLQAGNMVEDIDLMEIIYATVDRFKKLLEEKNQQIHFDIEQKGRIILKGRSQHLQMAFRHLLSNASKFTPRGGNITVGMKVIPQWFHLEVADTGMGLSRSQKEGLSRWIRQGNDMATMGLNIGLGLMIIKSVVEGHQGKLGFESRLGCGSRFWIELPFFSCHPFYSS